MGETNKERPGPKDDPSIARWTAHSSSPALFLSGSRFPRAVAHRPDARPNPAPFLA